MPETFMMFHNLTLLHISMPSVLFSFECVPRIAQRLQLLSYLFTSSTFIDL